MVNLMNLDIPFSAFLSLAHAATLEIKFYMHGFYRKFNISKIKLKNAIASRLQHQEAIDMVFKYNAVNFVYFEGTTIPWTGLLLNIHIQLIQIGIHGSFLTKSLVKNANSSMSRSAKTQIIYSRSTCICATSYSDLMQLL